MSRANPIMIQKWAKRDKCWMCKHRFSKPVLLPVLKAERGKLQPNINAGGLFHLYDTHGLDPHVVREWLVGSIYGWKLTEMGIKK